MPQNYLTLYLMNCHRVLFWNLFAWWDAIDWHSLHWLVFPRNPLFKTIVQFGYNLGQTQTTSCPRQLCLMFHSLKILKYGMMGCNSYIKVTVNLPKKISFRTRAIWAEFGPKLCNVMSHDSLFEDLFEVLWHDEAQ